MRRRNSRPQKEIATTIIDGQTKHEKTEIVLVFLLYSAFSREGTKEESGNSQKRTGNFSTPPLPRPWYSCRFFLRKTNTHFTKTHTQKRSRMRPGKLFDTPSLPTLVNFSRFFLRKKVARLFVPTGRGVGHSPASPSSPLPFSVR